MPTKTLAVDLNMHAFNCLKVQDAAHTALLVGTMLGLAGCASSEDFEAKGKPEIALNRIEVLSTAKQNFDDGVGAIRRGNIADAKALFKKGLKESLSKKEYKIAYDCYLNTGRCEEVQENLDEAENYFRQTLSFAEKHFPSDKSKISDAVASLGQVLAKKGNHKGGEKLLRKAVDMRISQENWEMALDHAFKLKWFYEKTNQPAKQIENLEELIKLQKLSKRADQLLIAKLYFEKGQKELNLHQKKDALESFKETHEALKVVSMSLESGPLLVDYASELRRLDKDSESDHAILIAEKIANDAPDSPAKAALKEKIAKFKREYPSTKAANSSSLPEQSGSGKE